MQRNAVADRRGAPKPAPDGSNQRASDAKATPRKTVSTLNEIRRMSRARDERRKNIVQARANREMEKAQNIANGNLGDVDFQRMIRDFRAERAHRLQPMAPPGELKICIAVRKRPINAKEIRKQDHDSVSCFNPEVTVHDCKLRVDGITKYLDSTDFRFDYAFGEDSVNDDVYFHTAKPLVPFVVNKGRATVFAYGQTGSGKTFTMQGIQQRVVEDLFALLHAKAAEERAEPPKVFVSYFEIYGGRCQDLLNNRHRLAVLQDGRGEVHIAGLEENVAADAAELAEFIERGNTNRTTHATESNDESSRSHAICQISLREEGTGKQLGRLSLIDLAGSERGADTNEHNRQRRMEGAEINKSLLALKECIRALDNELTHIPYRASKLTLVLKDSFTRKTARTVMIATINPAASSADHTLNTLRYADRVKEQRTSGADTEDTAAAAAAADQSAPLPPPPAAATHATPEVARPPRRTGHSTPAALQARNEARLREGFENNKSNGISVPQNGAAGSAGEGGDARADGGVRKRPAAAAAAAAAAGYGRRVTREDSSDDVRYAAAAAAAAGNSEEEEGAGVARPKRQPSGRALRSDAATAAAARNGKSSSSPEDAVAAAAGQPMPRHRRHSREAADARRDEEAGVSGSDGAREVEGDARDSAAALQRSQASEDIEYLHETIRRHNAVDNEEVEELHRTVQNLFEEEEELLNLHMEVIQENAELLTREGRLLQNIQGDDIVDYDIDKYAEDLAKILERKAELTGRLQRRLHSFRRHLDMEENVSRRVRNIPQY